MTVWAGRRVVLGVSGGIACYKSCILARRLTEMGARVDVVLTQAATEFVRPLTFEALTGRPVHSSIWESGGALSHLQLGQKSDVVLIAPATAHLIARLAHGLADDLLTTLVLASTAPILIAPAMNDVMFAHPQTRANLERLQARRVATVGPEIGALAEGPSELPGRMSEPETILAHAARLLRGVGPLARRRIVVTAGPTRESIDPVRVVTNRSSGKMGYRIAEAAWERGAEVVLISGPVALAPPVGVTVRPVESTRELEAAVREELPLADVLVMAAAPADFRPSSPSDSKRSRIDGALAIPMEPTEDILTTTRGERKPGSLTVGFALETGDALAKGRAKLERKDLDLIVVNDALESGAGFEHDTNRVALIGRDGTPTILPLQSKREVAEAILDAVENALGR
ncbi:MAG TPA: bifunctional phosphopantothenoylcysteine decarboxylase/phosphopantothenate--cysteine ligase CoaBC [Gemmatimonadales bacterium]